MEAAETTRVGAAIFGAWMLRVARAYGALLRCEGALARLRARLEAEVVDGEGGVVGKATWIAAVDMQQRLVLGAATEILRFVVSVRTEHPDLVPELPRRESEVRAPNVRVVGEVRAALLAAAWARSDVLAAREHLRSFLAALLRASGDERARAHWYTRLTPPEQALDAGTRALDRFVRATEVALPMLLRAGVAIEPPLEILG
jgi:hypothetical protein